MGLQDLRYLNGQKIVRFTTTPTVITIYTSEGVILPLIQGTEEADYFIQLLDRRGFMSFRKPVINIPEDKEDKVEKADDTTYGLFSKLTNGIVTFVKRVITQEEREAINPDAAKPRHVFEDRAEHEKRAEAEGAMVAVIDGKEVRDIEKVQHYIKTAVKLKDAKGFANLLKRLSAISKDRQHSVDDALDFLSTAEMPITDDGDIITYRVVGNYREDKGDYFDKHTNRVPQNVGTVVTIEESLINRSRSNSCAEGLHVCTLRYISSFFNRGSRDGLFVCLVRPEDIIVVPHNEKTKVRVSSYRVVGLLSDAATAHVLSGKSLITFDGDSKVNMAELIAGVYPPVVRNVLITASRATSMKISSVNFTEATETPVTVADSPATKSQSDANVINEPMAAPEPEKKAKVTKRHKKMAKTESTPVQAEPKPLMVPKPRSNIRLKPSAVNKEKSGERPTHTWKSDVSKPVGDQRMMTVIQDVIDNQDMSYTDICKAHGVARSTVFGWLAKYTDKS